MKRQTGNYTKTPIALALAAMLSVLASGAQAEHLDETQDISGLDMRILMTPSPEHIQEVIAFTSELRDTNAPFDVVVSAVSYGLDQQAISNKLQAYMDVGTTWWLEWLDCGRPGTLQQTRAQILAGPPEI